MRSSIILSLFAPLAIYVAPTAAVRSPFPAYARHSTAYPRFKEQIWLQCCADAVKKNPCSQGFAITGVNCTHPNKPILTWICSRMLTLRWAVTGGDDYSFGGDGPCEGAPGRTHALCCSSKVRGYSQVMHIINRFTFLKLLGKSLRLMVLCMTEDETPCNGLYE